MESKETGVIVLSIGSFFFILGATLIFDKALMIAGNLLIIIGTIILSKSRIFNLLTFNKIQGLIVFGLGLTLMMLKFVVIGFIIEFYGLYLLFVDEIPTLSVILKRLLYKSMRMIR